MKRFSILLLVGLVLPACAPSTEWNPNFMHWSNPNSKAILHPDVSAAESAADGTMLGDATETDAMSESDTADQTDTNADAESATGTETDETGNGE